MRTTLLLDDELLSEAKRLTNIKQNTVLIRQALETLIAIESGKRLAMLGGSDASAQAAVRDRP